MNETFFKRYEYKFLLDPEQRKSVEAYIRQNMVEDEYFESDILNLYFDTDHDYLIRHSLDKPFFKEKLRLRSYGVPSAQSNVYLELKKKYDGVVYKRREGMKLGQATAFIETPVGDTQIEQEISFFIRRYRLKPKIFLSYHRKAYRGKEDEGFRLTFDEDITYRLDALDLSKGIFGEKVLPPSVTLMEIKAAGAIPFDFVRLLSEHKIYQTSFSKYGMAYQMIQQQKGEQKNVIDL